MPTEREACGLGALLPVSCRGRAESFARRLHTRLRSLGGGGGGLGGSTDLLKGTDDDEEGLDLGGAMSGWGMGGMDEGDCEGEAQAGNGETSGRARGAEGGCSSKYRSTDRGLPGTVTVQQPHPTAGPVGHSPSPTAGTSPPFSSSPRPRLDSGLESLGSPTSGTPPRPGSNGSESGVAGINTPANGYFSPPNDTGFSSGRWHASPSPERDLHSRSPHQRINRRRRDIRWPPAHPVEPAVEEGEAPLPSFLECYPQTGVDSPPETSWSPSSMSPENGVGAGMRFPAAGGGDEADGRSAGDPYWSHYSYYRHGHPARSPATPPLMQSSDLLPINSKGISSPTSYTPPCSPMSPEETQYEPLNCSPSIGGKSPISEVTEEEETDDDAAQQSTSSAALVPVQNHDLAPIEANNELSNGHGNGHSGADSPEIEEVEMISSPSYEPVNMRVGEINLLSFDLKLLHLSSVEIEDQHFEADDQTVEVEDQKIIEEDQNIADEDQDIADEDQKIADEDQKVADEYQKVADEDQKVADEDQKEAHEDQKVAHEDQKVAHEDQKVADEDQKVADEDQKVADEDQKVADEDQKVADEDQKIADEDQRIADEDQRIANESRKIADESRKIADESRKNGDENRKNGGENEMLEDEDQKSEDDEESSSQGESNQEGDKAEEDALSEDSMERDIQNLAEKIYGKGAGVEGIEEIEEVSPETVEPKPSGEGECSPEEETADEAELRRKYLDADSSDMDLKAVRIICEEMASRAMKMDADVIIVGVEEDEQESERAKQQEQERLDDEMHRRAIMAEEMQRRATLAQEKIREEEEEEEREARAPRVRRSTSLKTGKTPPGTPSRKKIVRFADVLGLDLADVRTFLDEIPHVPRSAFQDLAPESNFDPVAVACHWEIGSTTRVMVASRRPRRYHLTPLFPQPGAAADFMDRIRERCVCLESAMEEDVDDEEDDGADFFGVNGWSVLGTVRVRNVAFYKTVHARASADGWRSHADVPASYLPGSCDGFSDRFAFEIRPGIPPTGGGIGAAPFPRRLPNGGRLEFAVRFQCQGSQYWDNNLGANYVFSVEPLVNPAGAARRPEEDERPPATPAPNPRSHTQAFQYLSLPSPDADWATFL